MITEGLQVKWKLSFYDEFEYEAKNGYDPKFNEKWESDRGVRPLSGINQIRIPDNVEVTDGKLKIHTRREHLDTLGDGSSTADLDAKMPGPHTFTTGNIWNREDIGPEGYYEASYKYAYTPGFNQSFWAMTRSKPNSPKDDPDGPYFVELDFNEGHFPRRMATNIHCFDENGKKYTYSIKHFPFGSHDVNNIETPNFGTDFNKFGGYFEQRDMSVAWDQGVNADNYRAYSNDTEIRRTRGTYLEAAPLRIWCSIAVYPSFAGGTESMIPDDTTMEYEYVRFYEPLPVTKDDLNQVILTAEELVSKATVGTETGNYSQKAIDDFNVLINNAKEINELPDPTEEEIRNAVTALNEGIETFKKAAVGDRSVVSGLIGEAEKLLERYPEGTGFMQCMSGIYNGLKEAADLAKVTVNSPYPTQSELDEKIGPLETMLARFMNGVNFSGTTNGDQTIDLRETSRMADITIRAEDTPEILLPDTVKAEIKITRQLSKDIRVKITIPKDAELRGEFKLPKDAEASSQEWTIENSIEMGGVKSSKPVRIELNGKNDSKIGVIRRTGENSGIIEEITKTIREDSQGAAEAALNEATKVVRVEGSLVLYTLETEDYAVYRTKETESPSPTPSATPDDNHNNNNNNSWNPGGNLTPGIWLPGSNGNNKVKFKDIAGHWAEEEIKELAKEGTIKGRSETEYEPEGTVTRAEFAAMITRALDLNMISYQNNIADVAPNSWYANEVQTIIDAGIMSGDPDGAFRPEATITRQEMAKVIVNAYILKTGAADITAAEPSFSDNGQIADWAKEAVGKAAGLGLMQGMNDGRFDPMGNATRAQSAVVIFRLGK